MRPALDAWMRLIGAARARGVPVIELARAFEDPKLVLAEDLVHGRTEPRYVAFGRVRGGVLTVRFTVRVDRVRIIGAGWRKGKVFYEQANSLHG